MSERVIALDPGGRSGYATATMSLDELRLGESGVLPQKDMALWLAGKQSVAHLPLAPPWAHAPSSWDVIVCESWRPQPRGGSMDWIQGSPLIYAQHVGQIRLIAQLSGAKYVEQQPKDKYSFITHAPPPPAYPPKLLALDAESTEQHDVDARYHLWVYFFRNWFSGSTRFGVVKT